MEWLSDFVRFCLDNGFVGLALLLFAGAVVVIAALGVLAGIAAASRAFMDGWRKAGQAEREKRDEGVR